MRKKNKSRRDFLKLSAATGVGYWVSNSSEVARSESPNAQIQFACVGVSGKGDSDSNDCGRMGKVVAICDVDERGLAKKAARFPEAKKYFDYRTMLDELGDEVDAVTVSTPDHNHAPAAAIALRNKKHCFVQKPMTQSIHEARVLSELAQENGVATMMGNQGTANTGLRRAAAVIQQGTLGKVSEVHVWTNRPIWPQGIDRPQEKMPVPKWLHWDQWIGPSEFRPYHPAYHPEKWRGFWDFGTGALGDMACHTVNMPFMALDLKDPTSIQAETSTHNGETYPSWAVIDFEFPERHGRPPIKFTWYDGGKRPPQHLFQGVEQTKTSGCLVVGEKGTLFSPGDYAETYQLLGGIEDPADVDFVESPGHFEEWVRAIDGGPPAVSNFPEYAGPLTENILLGNLAVWAAAEGTGKKIEWDAANLKPSNAPELETIVKREYRHGYVL
jgi:predicted dehydrogenase